MILLRFIISRTVYDMFGMFTMDAKNPAKANLAGLLHRRKGMASPAPEPIFGDRLAEIYSARIDGFDLPSVH